MRVASLGPILLVGLCMTGAAQARNEARTSSGDLPCNDACRAWLSWTPSAQDVPARRSAPEASTGEPDARRERRTPPARPAARTAKRVDAPKRHDVEEPPASEVDVPSAAVASRSDERAFSKRHGTPVARRPSPLSRHRPSETETAAPAPAQAPAAPPPKDAEDGPVDEGSARLKAVSAASDAAILATPLYQPPSPEVVVHKATVDRPRPPDSNASAAPDSRPDLAVGTVADDASHADERPTAPPSTPPMPGAEPLVETPHGITAPAIGSAQPAAAASSPAPVPAPPPRPNPPAFGAKPESAPSAALPASDLENLDEGRQPEGDRHGALGPRPWTWPLLIGGLALLSLVGARRRR